MDDRFKNENSGFNFSQNNNSADNGNNSANKKPLGDFSVNIDSSQKDVGGVPLGSSVNHSTKKFEVHLPDSADLIPDFTQSSYSPKQDSVKPADDKIGYTRQVAPASRPQSTARTAPSKSAAPANSAAAPVRRAAPANSAATPVRKAAPERNTASRASNAKKPEISSAAKSAPAAPKANKTSKNTKAAERKEFNFAKSALVVSVCLIFIAIVSISVSTIIMDTINDILAIDGDSKKTVTVKIEDGSDYYDVFETLEEAGLVRQPFITDIFCKYRHYHQVDKKQKDGTIKTIKIEYQPGVYYVDEDMGIENILEMIMVSSSGNKDTVTLTFPEGWSIAKIFAKIEKYEVCEAEKLYANLEVIAQQYSFMLDIDENSGRYILAEGYLFPDTYDFFIGENASSVLKKLFNNFESRWTEEYSERLKELDMTMDEIITIASIIQREAKNSSEMPVISSVIHNRLKDQATYPTLDMNSTKDYIISMQNDYELFSEFYYNLYLNSYNTYSNHGLPPGPICNPGIDAIEAALFPADTNYKFFCHSDSGTLYLASTASEHQANAAKILSGN